MSNYSINATDISEYVRYQSCDRRFKLKFDNYKLAKEIPFNQLIFATSLDPVLEAEGKNRENDWESSLKQQGLVNLIDTTHQSELDQSRTWSDFVESLNTLSVNQNAYGREISIKGTLGDFYISCKIDFVLVLWENNCPKIRLVECKASRKDRTYHHIQVALYRMMICKSIKNYPIVINGIELKDENIECVVVRIDENTNKNQDIIQANCINLDTIEADINRLVSSDGILKYIIETNLSNLDYQLDEKCSDCTLSVHCLSESARQRRLELLGIDASTVKSLNQVGINNIDDLAEMDLQGNQARQLQQDISFTESLDLLQVKARTRRRTLPDGDLDPDDYQVEQLNYSGKSQLPEYIIDGERLIRVYLSVEYDYVENRIGALAAHVTKSEGKLDPKFKQDEFGKWKPDPNIKEYIDSGQDQKNKPLYQEKELEGEDLIKFKTSPWSGDYKEDNGSEKELIQGFLLELVDAISSVAETEQAPIHFYVWSRQEMTQLVEGCSRVSSQLLSHLRELLGCRESLDQLIYSCLSDEVDRRYALGWTGRDLAVVSSLKWFGRRYHWHRKIAGKIVILDRVFSQDVFDFKTNLKIDGNHQWATSQTSNPRKHQFEVRLRYFNSLSAAYWRAYWRQLPDPNELKHKAKLKKSIERYNQAQLPNYLREYFRARTHAIRWVEEGIRFKNREITKEPLIIANLPDFNLGVDNAAQAGIDFLRLDQHVKVTDWIAKHLIPPIYRISSGRTIPIANVRSTQSNQLTAEINLDRYNITPEVLQANCTIDVGSFIRVTPASDNPHQGQTLNQLFAGGSTCVVEDINWNNGRIVLAIRQKRGGDRYQIRGRFYDREEDVYTFATIDESPSDFVAGKVDQKLQNSRGNHVCQWLAPQKPQIPAQTPVSESNLKLYRNLLETLPLANSKKLDQKQIEAALNGLNSRIQLLQGPPGTGKTETTAIATFLRILARCHPGDIVLIAGHTHTSVDNLLLRLENLLPILQKHATDLSLNVPSIELSRVDQKNAEAFENKNIELFASKSCVRKVNKMRKTGTLVIGGTTNAILKMSHELNTKKPFKDNPQGFQTTILIVDEASMMVFPHFLALATLVKEDGEIMLAGDHRQLAPIITHDWENEDRPPVLLYQPYVSAYQAIQNLKENSDFPVSDQSILRSALSFSFRLPPVIRELIARLYRKDNIELEGGKTNENIQGDQTARTWENLLEANGGLYLVLHDERESKLSNPLEVEIIETILGAAGELPNRSTAILTPHRAQRSLLKTELADDYRNAVDIIDTVEKVQGGERDNVIVSATASNSSAIGKNVEFILGLNRSNVAFSRVKKCLIVVVSKTLLDYIPRELENYEEAILWKALRDVCSHLLFKDTINGHKIQVFTHNK
ncbi:AAA domain-containing protein [Roseofilum sp. BLCC_M154]|uniref:AAA domain-containing protein n=1 Tax=Roseofilum acuticapitatum BLCC-M154 TaxID=3022444 RepID=A0ABT7AUD6_9CYAN|nr:AAA domain-containing protein [Roseofilum acuticapitatum]MDJ1170521.1 AAA domain-containing protein [Roseofilum acuticapitatum BLCC-M154]